MPWIPLILFTLRYPPVVFSRGLLEIPSFRMIFPASKTSMNKQFGDFQSAMFDDTGGYFHRHYSPVFTTKYDLIWYSTFILGSWNSHWLTMIHILHHYELNIIELPSGDELYDYMIMVNMVNNYGYWTIISPWLITINSNHYILIIIFTMINHY